MRIPPPPGGVDGPETLRTPGARARPRAQVIEHYELEKSLADRLRRADPQRRRTLYAEVYDELFRRLPHHPQVVKALDPDAAAREVRRQSTLLRRYLKPGQTFLELGAGDCGLAREVAKTVGLAIAVEASPEITRGLVAPPNLRLILTDSFTLPLPDATVDLAYSNQFLEHLHPDDAGDQLREIARVLKPGARYVCVTPNALSGPHDVSAAFDDEPTGFHLKEYTIGEMIKAFREAGFTECRVVVGARGVYLPFATPAGPLAWGEKLLSALPARWRRGVSRTLPARIALGINFVATR